MKRKLILALIAATLVIGGCGKDASAPDEGLTVLSFPLFESPQGSHSLQLLPCTTMLSKYFFVSSHVYESFHLLILAKVLL